MFSLVAVPLLLSAYTSAQYTATYLPSNAPPTSEQDQSGTNQCGSGHSQTSMCQNVYINSVQDFCLWAPPSTDGTNSTIGETERIEVAWCMKDGYGTRLIPDGTIKGAHFVQTPDYVQVTGFGDFTKMNIPAGDQGGELDPHGADGNGNPIGGLVFGSSFGQLQQYHEWTNYMAVDQFCIRACKDSPNAPLLCNHIYDVMGCNWNMPGNYDLGVFENCVGDTGPAMGIYVEGNTTSTFQQGQPVTPPAQPAPSSSQCSSFSTIQNGQTAAALPSASSGSSGTTTSTGSGSRMTSTGSSRNTSPTGSPSATTTAKSSAGHVVPTSMGGMFAVAGAMILGLVGGAVFVL
ncbi:hypothetical protein DACRYDRAFT_22015 [Dacryopinax primogenitus]|uniref:Macrofage activating glyco protein n=1 Tax=Dacryopinax primogenitus (strain DJM 731) TaxID=1858805 RepID=M5FWL9_DACPD|nr:uncharacterized protein DACRYDRAFT_22015 [Dacryopinax primogenitus]EJU02341.1 hypothetical protein DACRYDRAFT_22015 [Dacryopinax primogenitus]